MSIDKSLKTLAEATDYNRHITKTVQARPNMNGTRRQAITITVLRIALIASLLAILSFPIQADTFVAYGPVTYTRSTGAPAPVTTSFTVFDATATYTLIIDSDGVSSAVVTLNGVEIVKPNEFNSTVKLITKQVTLKLSNQLTVEMRGAPGKSFKLQIIGVDNNLPTITAHVTPAPNAAGWNKSPATVTFTCSDKTSGIDFCSEPVTVPVDTSNQVVQGTATDKAGNSATASVTVKVDKTPPNLNVTSPDNASTIFVSKTAVTGTVGDTLSGLASVTCNGTAGTVNGGNFSCTLTLSTGTNAINIIATDVAGNTTPSNLSLTYARVPIIAINSPANQSYHNISPTTVTGTVDDPDATVTINSVQAAVSNGSFSVALPLAEGPNTITASATSANGAIGTSSIEVTLDTTPPRVTITTPQNNFVTSENTITIAGSVNDIVVGTVNAEQAQVSVNGLAAQVANRSFLAVDVPLAIGNNIIQAVGRDRVGNAATTQITVIRQPSTKAQIRLISGSNQMGVIGSTLPAQLVIALTDAGGNPVPSKQVIFKVTRNDGMVSAGGPAAPTVVATTNSQGQALVQWKLGMRSGAGGNTVEAYSIGFDGTAIFTATGMQGPAGKIVIDTGNNQVGVIDQQLPKPLIAVVVDEGNNRLAGVPVTFTVKEGGGNIGGQSAFTVSTDPDGRASAYLTLGLQEGNANNLVEASFPSITGFPAAFTASGRAPGNPANTIISGVVLDNSNVPIPGVTIRAVLTSQLNSNSSIIQSVAAVQSDAQGQFTIPQAPVGFVKLLVDGSTAQSPGKYPTLDYEMVTVAGQNNTLGMPIFLLPLNTSNQLCVTATTGGGTLTVPEAPGFSLTFGPGQVTFPGGSKTGCISVTVVHGDKVPMVPGFGQQPRFIVTIQPSGAVFTVPAAITLPNVDGLRPRAVTEMYSFDHDIGSFVAIGTGIVSDDGLVIRSSPGVGVIKAGWHCGGDPAASGTCADCGECEIASGSSCVPAPFSKACDDKNECTTDDQCTGGSCSGTPIKLDTDPVTRELTITVPLEIVNLINRALERLTIVGIVASVDVVKEVTINTEENDCCDASTGKGRKKSGSVSTDFGAIKVDAKLWPPGPTPKIKPTRINLGFVSLTIEAEFSGGLILGVGVKVSGGIGHKQNDCSTDASERAGCMFANITADVNTSFRVETSLTAYIITECPTCEGKKVEVKAHLGTGSFVWPFTVSNISYNESSCSSGISGGEVGAGDISFTLSVDFEIDIPEVSKFSYSREIASCKISLTEGFTCGEDK